MIYPNSFVEFLKSKNVNFFCGVPDSLLKEVCFCINESLPSRFHKITSNEGAAVALGTGYHLATGMVPLVYLQNSGLGNAINPLASLCDSSVYKIPLVLLIGWRGEPGKIDEPQHIKQGEIQNDLLKNLDIPFEIIDSKLKNFNSISNLIIKSKKESRPVAIIVKKGTFSKFNTKKVSASNKNLMPREEVLDVILNSKINNEIFIITTGKTSREFYELRKKKNRKLNKDLLIVGSMGHASQIALGVAMFKDSDVYCLDGDGSVLMHMGSLAISGTSEEKNFKHIILNNGSHESVGGQPTVGKKINFSKIAKNCGYKMVKKISTLEELKEGVEWIRSNNGPILLEIIIRNGSRSNLGRPIESPLESKINFMRKTNDK